MKNGVAIFYLAVLGGGGLRRRSPSPPPGATCALLMFLEFREIGGEVPPTTFVGASFTMP